MASLPLLPPYPPPFACAGAVLPWQTCAAVRPRRPAGIRQCWRCRSAGAPASVRRVRARRRTVGRASGRPAAAAQGWGRGRVHGSASGHGRARAYGSAACAAAAPTGCRPRRLAVGASIASCRWRSACGHAAAAPAGSSSAAGGTGATGCGWAWRRPRHDRRIRDRAQGPSVDVVSPVVVVSSSAAAGVGAPGGRPARRHQQLHTSWWSVRDSGSFSLVRN